MSSVDIIKKAQSLLAKKEYAKAANLLDPNIISFSNSFQFHYTLGLSFLYLGDIGGAELYFKKARNIKMQDINLAYERMLKSDVRYRFVVDMSSLKVTDA